MAAPAAITPEVRGQSRIGLHDLSVRLEARDGAPECIVGRVETGAFIAVPPVAGEVIRLLEAGMTVDEAHDHIQAQCGRDVDVAGFVAGLIPLGFVSTVDSVDVPAAPPPVPTLPWLRAAHVRWLLTWPVSAAVALATLAAIVVIALRPRLFPGYHDLLWTPRTSVVLAGNAAFSWSIIALHELAHLATARAAGVPGRMSFGTRLQFLVAQTDVSGIWAAGRRRRLTVYLSGIAVNLVLAAAAVLVRASATAGSALDRIGADVAMLSLLMIAPQFLLFMRTDLYFVLQDVTGCRNLYADGSAYVRWWARRRSRPDPSTALSPRERRAVRTYAWHLLVGTTACVAVAVTVSLPFTITLLATAARRVIEAPIDGLATLLIIGGYWVIWSRAWWRRHGHRVRGLAFRRR